MHLQIRQKLKKIFLFFNLFILIKIFLGFRGDLCAEIEDCTNIPCPKNKT